MTDDELRTSEFDKWHLFGVEGCVHEHDDADQIRWNQADEVACDCTEHAEWESRPGT